MTRLPVKAVFFDVDFTLIYPGPMFQGVGYHQFCARYGIGVEIDRFADAVRAAASILNDEKGQMYDPALFVRYTRCIIEGMGGQGDMLDACAEEIYAEWAACHHFEMYEDVPAVLKELALRGIRVGLISNSHRCLGSFKTHFELEGLIAGALSSCEHGFMKPHPSIFESALELLGVSAEESVMVGDSLRHDIEGARKVGMRAVLLQRSAQGRTDELAEGVPVIRGLSELPPLLA